MSDAFTEDIHETCPAQSPDNDLDIILYYILIIIIIIGIDIDDKHDILKEISAFADIEQESRIKVWTCFSSIFHGNNKVLSNNNKKVLVPIIATGWLLGLKPLKPLWGFQEPWSQNQTGS